MRTTIILISILFSLLTVNAQDTILPNYPGLMLWLRADSVLMNNDSTVYEWIDLSQMHNSVLQNDSVNQPKYMDSVAEVNNKPVMEFSGNEWFNGGDICDVSDSGITIFIIGKSINSSGTFIAKSVAAGYTKRYALIYNSVLRYLFHSNSLSNIDYSIQYDTVMIYTATTNMITAVNKLYLNGLVADSIDISASDMNSDYDFLVGAYNNNIGTTPPYPTLYLNGYIAEIIIYDRPLSFDERYHIENYLRYRYFPSIYQTSVSFGSDIHIPYGFCDTILDAGSKFTDYHWNTGDTTQTISVSYTGTYSVTATDIFGYQSSDSIYVEFPSINYDFPDTTICQYDTLIWNSGFTDSIYTVVWQNSDTIPIINIYNSGQYYFKVIDTISCYTYSDTISVIIDSFPSSQLFINNDTTLCIGTNLYTENSAVSNFLWSTGDTTNHITIQDSGTYFLTAYNQHQCVAHDTVTVSIAGIAPVVDFSVIGSCQNDTIMFVNNSYTQDSSNITDFMWQIDTVATSQSQDTSYIFQNYGTYHIILSIITDSGCYNSKIDAIQIYRHPAAGFTHSALCSGNPVYFTDTSTSIDGNITTWNWDFGNNNYSIQQNPENTYYQPGNYTVELVATTQYGCTDTIKNSIYIKPGPIAGFSVSNTCINRKLLFIDKSQTDITNNIINYTWKFGNGITSNNTNPTQLYQDTGYYYVQLTVQSLNGCIDSLTQSVYVNPAPHAYFSDSFACVNNLYKFTDSSFVIAGAIINWNWNIDSLYNFSVQNPVYTFSDTGYHRVSLAVVTDSSCTDTIKVNDFYVQILPDAGFTSSQNYGVPYKPIYFYNDTTGQNYYWDFGDGNEYTGENPFHNFLDSGIYIIHLTAIDSMGCTDSSYKQIKVMIPDVDLCVSDVKTETDNGYMSISCVIINYGNIPVENIDIFLHVDEGYVIKEIWNGVLNQGCYINYEFSSTYQINELSLPELVCAKALPTDYDDVDLSNNEYCKANTDEFSVFAPYPNPANSIIYFDVILPAKGSIAIDFYDKSGKYVNSRTYSNLIKGYNKLSVDIMQFSQGTYTFVVKYSDVNQKGQFVIER